MALPAAIAYLRQQPELQGGAEQDERLLGALTDALLGVLVPGEQPSCSKKRKGAAAQAPPAGAAAGALQQHVLNHIQLLVQS